MEIKRIEDDKRALLSEIDEYRNRIATVPTVEKELNALNRDYQNLKDKYADISNKSMNAQLVREMESERKGGQFSIVSPAYLPIEPSKPNRLMILILSFLLAIGISSALAIFQEKMDVTLRTSEQIKQLTGVPVLSSISYIITKEERTSNYLKKIGWAFIILVCIGSVFYGIDRYVIKLDELWIVILERMKMFA